MAAKLVAKRTTWAVMQVSVSLPAGLVEDDEDDEDDYHAFEDAAGAKGQMGKNSGGGSSSGAAWPRLSQHSAAVPVPARPAQPQPQGRELLITVDLWVAEGLSAVLRVDSRGRVQEVHEPTCRPAALLFGLVPSEMMSEPLSKMLQLPPGKSVASLQQAGPKSSMKAARGASKGDASKVGRPACLDTRAAADGSNGGAACKVMLWR
jgi:hypothetical protein